MSSIVECEPQSEEHERQITVVVIDDHAIVVESVVATLQREPDIEVVGVAGRLAQGEVLVTEHDPDVVILDYSLPDADGLKAVRRLRALRPQTRVLMLTGFDHTELVTAAMTAGCSAFVTKTSRGADLVNAIRLVHRGQPSLPPEALKELLPRLGAGPRRGDITELTAREVEILELAALGYTNQVIARELSMSVNTVRNHFKRILPKLGSHSKVQAVAVARGRGVLNDHLVH